MTAPDLPGHGAARDWDGGSLLAQSVALAGEALAGPVNLVGHSFGAVTALALAMERPGEVATLALIEPVLFAAAAGAPGHALARRRFGPMQAALAAGDRDGASRAFSRVWGTEWDALPARQRAYLADRIHLIEASRADLWDDALGLLSPGRLEGLGMPVLLLESASAEPVVGEILDALQPRIPRAGRATVPGAHMSPITHPAEMAGTLAAFWDRAV